jgi:hypothetical protein
MIHLFKASDKSWVFSGTTIPSNMEDENYIQGVLPEGETWDIEYTYTYLDGVAKRGDKIVIDESEINSDTHSEARLQAYPALAEQLDKLFHDIDDGKLDKTGTFYTAIKTVKDANPKE